MLSPCSTLGRCGSDRHMARHRGRHSAPGAEAWQSRRTARVVVAVGVHKSLPSVGLGLSIQHHTGIVAALRHTRAVTVAPRQLVLLSDAGAQALVRDEDVLEAADLRCVSCGTPKCERRDI